MLTQLYEKADKTILIEKLKKKTNLEIGLDRYFTKLQSKLKICNRKLTGDEEKEMNQLKLLHN